MEGENSRDDIYSNAVRAGKRTYFFDVKSTKGRDLYLTITESKKRYDRDGNFKFEKHKIFLYKEDFDKFSDGLLDVVNKIEELKASGEYVMEETHKEESATTQVPFDAAPVAEETEELSDVSFEDLED